MRNEFLTQLNEYNEIIWGNQQLKPDVFKQWCQGFSFSSFECSALIQLTGGPCAIIASVQASIICEVLFIRKKSLNDVQEIIDILLNSLLRLLVVANKNIDSNNLYWVYWSNESSPGTEETSCSNEPNQDPLVASPSTTDIAQNSSALFDSFISGLKCFRAESKEELMAVALSLSSQLNSTFAVLCFLYSVLFTHGLITLKLEMGDEGDPLIDPVYGHASQCLINLLLTGESTPYLFDGERDLSGYSKFRFQMKLIYSAISGIKGQPNIGFLTYMEAMRYCEVGWFLKNPHYPVWLIGSETHLTVLASSDLALVSNMSSSSSTSVTEHATVHQAEIEFNRLSIDHDDNGFINSSDFTVLLNNLKLLNSVTDLNSLLQKLDPENLGIILKKDFLNHFYPEEMKKQTNCVTEFELIHYNGLECSNVNNEVRYHLGQARLIDPTDELLETDAIDRSSMQQCLTTKWPTIRIKWSENCVPSIN